MLEACLQGSDDADVNKWRPYKTTTTTKLFEFLHSFIRRVKLPMHGEREAEQAARFPALLLDIVSVQVERRQPPTSPEKDEQPQATGDPALHKTRSKALNSLELVKGESLSKEVQSATD